MMAEQQEKRDIQMVERTTTNDDQMPTKDENPLMRSKADLSVWQTVTRFKRVGFMAMAAAFCAALDGYRKTLLCKTRNPSSQRIQDC